MTLHNSDSGASARIAFIGGGNMASALMGGLIQSGHAPAAIAVIEPFDIQAQKLRQQYGVQVESAAGPVLAGASLVVWAVKPQLFQEAARPCAAHVGGALQLSVMAGIRSGAISAATGSDRVVRSMPNTPALIGRGMTGLFGSDAVTSDERALVERLLHPTGDLLWVEREEQLDAVTALSGSGPAYVFYFVEAMMRAGSELGLSSDQARRLAVGTFSGAAALAAQSTESPQVLRQNVTSKGGTTHAAITTLEERGVMGSFVAALHAAARRAKELGDEFGG
ncbi:pyrroline-5-carboxylate reductase [Ideonella sp. DXS29W]|uniref:Pyrroline-5-carboxylate reductase n=1 Tax=Ideonella lacteola TaxID=2984193 RepID=A0ABU9BM91_9BURK